MIPECQHVCSHEYQSTEGIQTLLATTSVKPHSLALQDETGQEAGFTARVGSVRQGRGRIAFPSFG